MAKKIRFTDSTGKLSSDYYPVPAFKTIPAWFRDLPPFQKAMPIGGNSSAKRCVPLLDAMTGGYILPLPVDVAVSHKNGRLIYTWAHEPKMEFQAARQAKHGLLIYGKPVVQQRG